MKTYLDSITFLAASAYRDNCFLASPVNFGLTSFIGISSIISLNIDNETSGMQLLGKKGSLPSSITFLSNNQRLNDSLGASIP